VLDAERLADPDLVLAALLGEPLKGRQATR
jgi:hypothetical protein